MALVLSIALAPKNATKMLMAKTSAMAHLLRALTSRCHFKSGSLLNNRKKMRPDFISGTMIPNMKIKLNGQ